MDCVGIWRISWEGEFFFCSFCVDFFYGFMKKISLVVLLLGVCDFCMMRRFVVDVILSLIEFNCFLKGFFVWVGFKIYYLDYLNVER